MRSATNFYFAHNERNVIGVSADDLAHPNCSRTGNPYCASAGWLGPDGVPGSRDEHRIGLLGSDGAPDSPDDGTILFRINSFEQYHSYATIPLPGEINPINRIATAGYRYNLGVFSYPDGRPVLGTTGSNNVPYGPRFDRTTARFHRAILSPEGNHIHTIMYWDHDQRIVNTPGRGRLSDGSMVVLVVDPVTPIIRLSAPSGQQFLTTPLVTLHTPRSHAQTSYVTEGVVIELLSLGTQPIFFRINNGPALQYTGAFTLRGLPSGRHTLVTWLGTAADAPRYTRNFILNPPSPSAAEARGTLLFGAPEERQRIAHRLTQPPFYNQWIRYQSSFVNDLPRQLSKYSAEFPLRTRGANRDLMNLSSVPWKFLVPHHLTSNMTADQRRDYGVLAKNALLSITTPEFIGAEIHTSADVWRASPDLLHIPNAGMNEYIFLPLAYDLLKAHFLREHDPVSGTSPIEELKIRENLAKLAYTMLKSRDSMGVDVRGETALNPGDAHHRLGCELIAYVIGASMPSYASVAYGKSGFNRISGGYLNTPYPNQALSWFELLTDPNVPTPGYPNNISKAMHFKIFDTYEKILREFGRADTADWMLPTTGTFWLGANGFAVLRQLASEGTVVSCPLPQRSGVAQPAALYSSSFPCGELIWTMDGLKLVSSWNDIRALELREGSGPAGYVGAMELSGYEAPFIENLAIASMIHARLYGAPLSANVDRYFDTKMARIIGNFDSRFLVERGTNAELVSDPSRGTPVLNNQQLIALAMPLGAFHPLISPSGPRASDVIWALGEYASFWPKKIAPSRPLNMVLFASVAVQSNR
ncbi:MAG: hypothetical protein EBZ48_10655 [Proteobacteria bacterium]|nr:hypothetical protein [Pseudomonadota bacterium]